MGRNGEIDIVAQIRSAYASKKLLSLVKECVEELSACSDRNFLDITKFQEEVLHKQLKLSKVANIPYLNRYRDVIPYEHSQIKLKEAIDYGRGKGSSDYINASLITDPYACGMDALPGFPKHPYAIDYIATQGPLLETSEAFWRMVIEQNVKMIVMLTTFTERGRDKCAEYFPRKKAATLAFNTITLETLNMREYKDVVEREILVVFQKDERAPKIETTVLHHHLQTWPDHGVPKSPEVVFAVLNSLQRIDDIEKPVGPAVVHCSAGIGRSGVIIALHIILRRLLALSDFDNLNRNDNDVLASLIDLTSVVRQMRQQRTCMVQNIFQFQFCYQTLLSLLEKSLGNSKS